MKFLSQLFEARGIGWTSSAFTKARRKLVALYLVIIAMVIGLFASLVVLQVSKNTAAQKIPAESQIVLNAEAAQALAISLKPGETIEDTEYILEENTLHYIVSFSDGEDVEVDMLSGTVQLGQDGVGGESFFELFTDDVNEIIWWIGIIVFLCASTVSAFVASLTLKPIAASIEKQKQFVSDASHELRNPLASLQTTLESYIRSPDRSRVLSESIADDLLEEVKRLIATSESLLALEQHEKRVKQISSCDVSRNVTTTLQRLAQAVNKKNIIVSRDISPQLLWVDTRDLDTILYNLLHNAIKFSNDDSEIKINWDGRKLVIADTGLGIDAKHLPRIFERFYKTEQARSFATNSNGLGLALVQDIVSSYGGVIAVDSTPRMGTTFTVTL